MSDCEFFNTDNMYNTLKKKMKRFTKIENDKVI